MIQRVLTYNGKVLQSNEQTFRTNMAVIDVDGNIYHSIIIGTQEWLIENLRTTKYKDGVSIPYLIIDASWLNDTIGAYCEYDNSIGLYKEIYGYMYNWYAISNSHGIAPIGWKIPSTNDWRELLNFLGGHQTEGHTGGAGKLKEVGLDYWIAPNAEATDEVGFKARGGGLRSVLYSELKQFGQYYASEAVTSSTARYYELNYYNGDYTESEKTKYVGINTRCMRYINQVEVSIGTQIWSKFNCDVGSGSYPNNSYNNVSAYGMLYTWDQAMAINVPGWHLPTAAEASTLINYLGGDSIAGGYLKDTSTLHWSMPNAGVDNSAGFTALGAGYYDGSTYSNFKTLGYWWTSTEIAPSTASYYYTKYDDTTSGVFNAGNKTSSFSVRLIKNT